MLMNILIGYIGNYQRDNLLAFTPVGDPSWRQRDLISMARMRDRQRDNRQKHTKRDREPGDKFITLGAVVGLLAGGAICALIFNHYWGLISGCIGFVVGAFFGALIGAVLGNLVKKRRRNRKADIQQ